MKESKTKKSSTAAFPHRNAQALCEAVRRMSSEPYSREQVLAQINSRLQKVHSKEKINEERRKIDEVRYII